MSEAVLLDTSFFLRFLNESSPLFKNADGYFRYFVEKELPMFISTISIAEYCVIGDLNELPLRNLQILPFNVRHAQRAGVFANTLFKARKGGGVDFKERLLIPNDSKLFAQADAEVHIKYYVTSDTESMKAYQILKQQSTPAFTLIDINRKHTEVFTTGTLGLFD